MSPPSDDDQDQFSVDEEEEDDDLFEADMEALRRACMLTGTSPDDLKNDGGGGNDDERQASADSESDSDADDDDLELLRQIRSRFSNSSDACEPLSLKPLCTLPPDASGDEEDDYQTLLAIRKRFSAYGNDTLENDTKQVGSCCKSVKETCDEISAIRNDALESFPDPEDADLATNPLSDNAEGQSSALIVWNQSDSCSTSMLPRKDSSFPKAAQVFMDAIKKNRASQKFIRNKLIQIEAKIEENRKLKERVKILKDFQVSCKRRTWGSLSQKKDPRVQLFLSKGPRDSRDSKVHDKKISALLYGPEENSHVTNYRMTMKKYLDSLYRKKWSKVEREALEKGIKQQFQEMVLQSSVDESSFSERPCGESNHIDDILASINSLEITPEMIREFLPKVKWEQLASMYLPGRSGAECETRWLNWEDPLINRKSWTAKEDKNLLYFVQEKGINNWFDIAVSLGTNRTPFQCLARYQRSLNASILKREWTKDEDAKLRSAVETLGEGNWQAVASALGGRAGTQCSNRWKKSLHPTKKREGRWTPEEDKRLKVAQMLFGPKNWNKTAQFVPGRTQSQCRDRYVNSLEPSLNYGEWTEEEDSRLRAAIEEHGYCWSKVAACVPRRTDNMCWRRCKVLYPEEVLLLKEQKKIKKVALMCNFVDREEERPALGPNDFLPAIDTTTKTLTYPKKQNGKLSKVPNKTRPRRNKINSESCSDAHGIDNSHQVETSNGHDVPNKKNNVRKQRRRRRKSTEPTGEGQVIVPVPDEHVTHREEQRETSCSDQIVGTSDGDDTTLAVFQRNKSKKRNLGPPSNDTRKKRKLVVSDCSVQDSPANNIQKGAGSHPEAAIMVCESEQGGLKLDSEPNVAFQEPVIKVAGVSPKSDHDADDKFLLPWGKKSKKRRPQTSKRSPQACPPSSATMKSESLPKGVGLGKGEGLDHCEPVSETGNNRAEGDHEDGDMTLACFLRNKSKRRRQCG
uniref:MYB type transcriptional factor R4 n=1 Tax=Pyrus betulifolia TaxID=436086 RepID=A0A1P8SEZ9_9ROSA|nr:MYB type transcriptional factor R4 [Pyrus betulifolia]